MRRDLSHKLTAPILPRKASIETTGDRTKTDTGRQGEYPEALERTLVKEFGKIIP